MTKNPRRYGFLNPAWNISNTKQKERMAARRKDRAALRELRDRTAEEGRKAAEAAKQLREIQNLSAFGTTKEMI